jgi:hypothetical protein
MEPLQVEALSRRSQRSTPSSRMLSGSERTSEHEGAPLDPSSTPTPPKALFETRQLIGIGLALVLSVTFGLIPLSEEHPKAHLMLAVGAFVATFWVFEVLPLPISGILPLVLMPIAGVADGNEVASWFWTWLCARTPAAQAGVACGVSDHPREHRVSTA